LICALLPAAELEAVEAATWYDEQRPGLGDDFLLEFKATLARIEIAPESFAPLEHYLGRHEVRRSLMRRFPYVVIFWCRDRAIYVVAVSHSRREPLYWLDRLD
jgi:hypothetical protein